MAQASFGDRNMARVQIDPALQLKLEDATEPVALCDSSAQVLGYFLPELHYQALLYRAVETRLGKEELQRRQAASGRQTLEDIWEETCGRKVDG
jgi:hypothetical protein